MPATPFTATLRPAGSWSCIVCRGDLDAPAGEELERAVDAALDAEPELIALDCRQVGFVGSYGLKLLLDAIIRCDQEGVDVVLLAGSEVRRLFELIGVPLTETDDGPAGAYRPGPLVQRPLGRAPRSYRHEWARPDPDPAT